MTRTKFLSSGAVAALGMLLVSDAAGQTAMSDGSCAEIDRRVAAVDQREAETIRKAEDWAALCRYAAADRKLGAPAKVVFIGDSLTEGWGKANPSFFADGTLNRGISGQTSQQILLRFYQDVIALRPRAVHIIAGSNDVAGNGGPTSMASYQNAIRAMTDLARANGIRVVIGSVLPADRFWWAPALRPAAQLRALNAWLRGFARERGYAFVDYHAAMTTPAGAMRAGLSEDGVHPNAAGYAVMAPLARRAIAAATR